MTIQLASDACGGAVAHTRQNSLMNYSQNARRRTHTQCSFAYRAFDSSWRCSSTRSRISDGGGGGGGGLYIIIGYDKV